MDSLALFIALACCKRRNRAWVGVYRHCYRLADGPHRAVRCGLSRVCESDDCAIAHGLSSALRYALVRLMRKIVNKEQRSNPAYDTRLGLN